jgi:hypothetical protein
VTAVLVANGRQVREQLGSCVIVDAAQSLTRDKSPRFNEELALGSGVWRGGQLRSPRKMLAAGHDHR